MTQITTPSASEPLPQFQQETVRQVSTLRELFAAMVRALPTRVTTASELQRATKLDMKLCWKVFRVIGAPDALAAAQYVPGPANMRDLLRKMGRLGVPDALLRRVEEASEHFEQLVEEHAGDRRTFDSMVSGYAGSGDGERAVLAPAEREVLLGVRALTAMERRMGMLLVMVAVEMLMQGVAAYLRTTG